MKVIVTGSSGFIGSSIAINLRKRGFEVCATARQSTPALEQALGMRVQELDLLNANGADVDIDGDAIVHCATANDVVSKDFCAGLNISVVGTKNLLELALKKGIAKIVFFSTLQVYGTELNGVYSESNAVNCESPYALNHFFGEELCRMYVKSAGVDVAVLRPSNVFGCPQAPTVKRSTLVPMCFVNEVVAGGKIVLRSSGRQVRNFVSNDEIADCCTYLLRQFPSGYNIFNVCSDFYSSILEIADMTTSAYSAVTGKGAIVEVQSDLPLEANRFTLETKMASLVQDRSHTTDLMKSVMRELIRTCEK